MDEPIFISFASNDRKAADGICSALERRGMRCWIATRNIGPGENFQETITRAIRSAKVMILVFSAHANNSLEVKKEIALAGRYNVIVVPVRVEDVVPNDALSYELAVRQWIDAFDDWDTAIERLVFQLTPILGTPATSAANPENPAAPPAPALASTRTATTEPTPVAPSAQKRSMVPLLAGALAVLLIAGGALVWRFWPQGDGSLQSAQNTGKPVGQPETPTGAPPSTSPAATSPSVNTAANTAATFQEALTARLASALPNRPPAQQQENARAYAELGLHKAEAVSLDPPGYWRFVNHPTVESATDSALEGCQLYFGQPCVLIVADDTVQSMPPDGKWPPRDMPRVHYSGDFDPAKIPTLAPGVRERREITGYRDEAPGKAVALHPTGHIFVIVGAKDQHTAEEQVLKTCNDDPNRNAAEGTCFLYAVANRVVLPLRLKTSLTPAEPPPVPQPTASSSAWPANQPPAPATSAGTMLPLSGGAPRLENAERALAAWRERRVERGQFISESLPTDEKLVGTHAGEFFFNSSDGPIEVHVGPAGRVYGSYRQGRGARRDGQLVGHVRDDGVIEGLWLQAESDRACALPREGTTFWGRFTISNARSPNPYGAWGYCSEQPNRSWNLQRR